MEQHWRIVYALRKGNAYFEILYNEEHGVIIGPN
jgi:hypothetical protein